MTSIIIRDLAQPSEYMDRTFPGNREEWDLALKKSSTLYIGNLSFYTTEEQIHELFSKCGEIKRIIMGLDKLKMTPCGFCFVEYYNHDNALDCLRYINGTKLDDRFIRVDLDPGFREGRQFGRGKHGGQVRDMFRSEFDPGRGGWAPVPEEKVVVRPEPQSYLSQYSVLGVKRKAEPDSEHVSKKPHTE